MYQLTCLMDNMPSENKALRAEHGLSIHIEANGISFLFDCGSGENTIYNAHKLGINLSNAAFTVLSHSHYDHAAGFRDMAERDLGGKALYTGAGFWEKKYAFETPTWTDLSCGFGPEFLSEHGISHTVCNAMTEIIPGVWAISGFPRKNAFETIPARFVKQADSGFVTDDFSDELCLVIDTADGLVLLLGCSHPGVLNMAESVHERLRRPIFALLGGTHLVEANEARVKQTIAALKGMGLRILGLSHCSGSLAEEMARRDNDVQCCHLAVGNCIQFSERK